MRTSEGTIIATKEKKNLGFLMPPHLLTDFQI